MDHIKVPLHLLKSIMEYLATRPYKEVDEGMKALEAIILQEDKGND